MFTIPHKFFSRSLGGAAFVLLLAAAGLPASAQVSGPVQVGFDEYAFTYTPSPDIGLFFSGSKGRYEFRDAAAGTAVYLNPQDDESFFRGRVGIGSVGTSTLTVGGSAKLGAFADYVQIQADGDLRFEGTADYLVPNNRYAFRAAADENIGLFFNAVAGEYEFRNSSAAPVTRISAYAPAGTFRIDDAGNLGIGTNPFAAKVNVNGALRIGDNSGSTENGCIRWNGADYEGFVDGEGWQSFTDQGPEFWSGSDGTFSTIRRFGPVVFGSGGTYADDQVVIENDGSTLHPLRVRVGTATKLRVTATGGTTIGNSFTSPPADGLYVAGDVTIGTTNPATGYKLSVDGKAIVEELTVELSGLWPDYVFAEGYTKPSIPELAEAIAELGHLPSLPSAETVAAEGQHVGAIQKNLVQTVEELTLYIIELEQRVAELEGR